MCLFRVLQDIIVTLPDWPQLLAIVAQVTTAMDHHLYLIPLVLPMETFVHQVSIALRELPLLYSVQREHSLLVHQILMSLTVYSVLVDSIALLLDSQHQMVSAVKESTVLQDRTVLKGYHVQQEVIALGVLQLLYHVNQEVTSH